MGELDALRGIAAISVMLYHYTWFIGHFVPGPLPSIRVPWGCHGVLLFFAISGFVIATTLRRTRTGGEFAVRRATRLLPAYWLAMLLTTGIVTATAASQFAIPAGDWPGNLAMVQFWADTHMVDGVYWTLNVELAFYICMAAIWRAGLLERIEPVVAGWLLLPLFWASHWEFAPGLRMLLLAKDAPFFAIGILAARLHSGERSMAQQTPYLAAALLVVWLSRPFEIAIVAAVVTIIMLAVATGAAVWLARAPLLWLGRISYPLYLTHAVIGYILIGKLRAAGLSADMATLVAIPVILMMADCIARWYDEPVRTWLTARAGSRPVPVLA